MSHLSRLAAAVISSGVAVASLAAPAGAATHHKTAAPVTSAPAAAAAGYLARHLGGKHHDHYTSSYTSGRKRYTYTNFGETADAVLAMDAAGVAQSAARRATAFLEKHAAGAAYAGTATTGYSPGAIGKLLLVAAAQHVGARHFGGTDLVAALQSTEGQDAAAGEYQQNPPGTDPADAFYSVVGQALPVLALAGLPQAGAQPDAAAVDFLAAQQCPDGGFRTQIMGDHTAECAQPDDVDSTGYAVQALLATGRHTAAAAGLAWLRGVEHRGGGFGSPANANSTALAVQAEIAGHADADKGVAWLRHHQLRCSAAPGRRGAVTYGAHYDDRALLASSQATMGLARRPLAWIDKGGAAKAAPALSCPRHTHH